MFSSQRQSLNKQLTKREREVDCSSQIFFSNQTTRTTAPASAMLGEVGEVNSTWLNVLHKSLPYQTSRTTSPAPAMG